MRKGNEMAKFTPGPWHEHGGAVVYGNDDDNGNGDVVVDMLAGHVRRSPEELNANARLIAAAPDLYEACEAALDFVLGPRRDGGSLIVLLEAALKKARGQQ